MAYDAEESAISARYRELHVLLDEIEELETTAAIDTEIVAAAESHERAARRMSWIGHRRVLDVSDRDAHRKSGYRSLADFMSYRLRISDPRRRMKQMEAVGRMYSIVGELLPPRCPNTARALAEGAIGPAHVQAVLETLDRIPAAIPADEKDAAEAMFADLAREHTPRELTDLGARLLAHLDPNGTLTDDRDRKRQRGLSLGKQDAQSMSRLRGSLDPTTRAMFDVVLAAWAEPGMNNPDDDQSPAGMKDNADPRTLREAAQRDTRSPAQRNHDALKALLETALDGGALGTSHRGLPPHLIVKITESELRELAGVGHTATGARLPISDVVELAARAHMHLAVFADHTAQSLYLGTAKRLANQAQRFMLFAQPGGSGCSCPSCSQPFTQVEVHHAERDWADGGLTDINQLAPACPRHNRMVGPKPGQWTTRIIREGPDAGHAEWTLNTDGTGPPPPARVNRVHSIGDVFQRYVREEAMTPAHNPVEPSTPTACDNRSIAERGLGRLLAHGCPQRTRVDVSHWPATLSTP
ncbi:DUF222 domain-containing protein [Streptomyces sp. SID6673]|nr:DUF222 domain-containing protein [Streptomyces sp. SID11726]NEB27093.1 DUF222 domain-containing protein [Streptomyces sp. SID6673]